MPTIHTLYERGDIEKIELDLNRREFPERRIYVRKGVREWLDAILPTMRSFHRDADLAPVEQVHALFHAFIVGKPLHRWRQVHVMLPSEHGIWELKTLDVRFFGWFPERDTYIAARVDSFERVKVHGLASGYRNETVLARAELDLDEPKFVQGGDLTDVVSNAD